MSLESLSAGTEGFSFSYPQSSVSEFPTYLYNGVVASCVWKRTCYNGYITTFTRVLLADTGTNVCIHIIINFRQLDRL